MAACEQCNEEFRVAYHKWGRQVAERQLANQKHFHCHENPATCGCYGRDKRCEHPSNRIGLCWNI